MKLAYKKARRIWFAFSPDSFRFTDSEKYRLSHWVYTERCYPGNQEKKKEHQIKKINSKINGT
jgi:hypothetical protein